MEQVGLDGFEETVPISRDLAVRQLFAASWNWIESRLAYTKVIFGTLL